MMVECPACVEMVEDYKRMQAPNVPSTDTCMLCAAQVVFYTPLDRSPRRVVEKTMGRVPEEVAGAYRIAGPGHAAEMLAKP